MLSLRQSLAILVLFAGCLCISRTAYAQGETDGCGDIDYSGVLDPGDLQIMSDYLFAAGPAPDSLLRANFDGRGGVNYCDYVAMLYAWAQFQGCNLINCTACRNSIQDYPVNSAETVFVRNHAIPAGASKHEVEIWANRTSDNLAFVFPFAYSCATSTATIDSIAFNANLARDEQFIAYESFTEHAVFAYHRALAGYGQTGKYRIATIYFNVTPLATGQIIELDTATWFGEETFISWSGPNAQPLQSMRPQLYGTPSTEAQPPSCCEGETGDVNGSGGTSLTDLTLVVNHLFVNFEPLSCPAAANINGDPDCIINLTDLTGLVNWLFVCFGCLPADCDTFDNFICGGQ